MIKIHVKFTNLSTLLNPKPPPTPKFHAHTQPGIIPILSGQNFTRVLIGMNKLWGKIEVYLKWVFIGAVRKPFPCVGEVDEQSSHPYSRGGLELGRLCGFVGGWASEISEVEEERKILGKSGEAKSVKREKQ